MWIKLTGVSLGDTVSDLLVSQHALLESRNGCHPTTKWICAVTSTLEGSAAGIVEALREPVGC
jgi:hypothetical protein